jgi:hypothetical protein
MALSEGITAHTSPSLWLQCQQYWPWLTKLVYWEYWPTWLVYAPVVPYYIWLAITARKPFFYFNANTCFVNGGNGIDSKMDMYKVLPKDSYPDTILVHPSDDIKTMTFKLHQANMHWPLYAKPDIGGKGKGVQLTHNIEEAALLIKKYNCKYLLQKPITWQQEVGIFYTRMPWQNKGSITGIVQKQQLQVLGNGNSTLLELIMQNPRAILQLKYLQQKFQSQLTQVPAIGTVVVLSDIGNHARGSKFVDVTHWLNNELANTIDTLSKQIDGFYYGRYDIKYNNWEQLCAGNNYSIIELNGASSEPTHIYDSNMPITKAWQIIASHWKAMYSISHYHLQHGATLGSLKQGWQLYKQLKAYNTLFK